MAYRYLGSATTNANGVAELPITGTGRGELDIVASTSNPPTSGSLVSETYSLWDCLVYDDGITDPKKTTFIKNGNGTVTISPKGTTLTASETCSYRNTVAINGDFEITLRATLSGSIRIGVQTSSDYNYAQSKISAYDLTNYYFKIRRVGSSITAQYSPDGVNWTNRSLETDDVGTHECYFMLLIQTTSGERSITYKDLKIYSI